MKIKQAFSYLIKNILKCLPLFLVVFFFSILFFTFTAINNTSTYLTSELKKDIKYEIKIDNRLCDIYEIVAYNKDDDFYGEYNLIYNILEKYNSTYYPYMQIYGQEANYFVYGVDDDYFDKNNIEIIDGMAFDSSKKEILVNENTNILDDNGESREVVVGDTISLPVGYKSASRYKLGPIVDHYEEYEVVGIYKTKNARIDKYEEDYLLNQRYYVSKENCVNLYESFIDLYKDNNVKILYSDNYYVPNIRFSCVSLKFETEEDLNNVYKEIDSDINAFNIKIKEQSEDKEIYELSTTLDYVNGILSPFDSLNENINFIEILMLIVCLIIVTLITAIIIKNRTKEFGIKKALGMNDKQVLLVLIIENFIIVLLAISFAILVFKISVGPFINKIVSNSINTQNELIRISNDNVGDIFSIENFVLDYSLISPSINNYLTVLLVTIVLVALISCLLYILIVPKNIKESLLGC